MRARARDVLRHPTWLGSWWSDWPARRRLFWRELLLAPGQGWLRWGLDDREAWDYEPDAHASHCVGVFKVAPPARRLAVYFRQWLAVPRLMLIAHEGYRFSWEEASPCWPSDMRDPDRHVDVWGEAPWRRRSRGSWTQRVKA